MLEKKHTVLCTSRHYREANELAKIRKLKPILIGKHGGGKVEDKLDYGLKRRMLLSKKIQKFSPDLTISFSNPDAARISFGLGIKHVAFSNSPHADAISRLTVPLLTKLLIPSFIPKREFSKYGLHPKHIVSCSAMDVVVILKNKKINSKLPLSISLKRKTIVFRTYESQASYISLYSNTSQLINALAKQFNDCNIVIIGRYSNEIKLLKQKHHQQNIIVLDHVVDSDRILSVCDLFIGSGGTMTTEAVLRGIPSISYNAVPNLDEKYLVKKKLLIRIKTSSQMIFAAKKLLASNNKSFKIKTRRFVSQMDDPRKILLKTIDQVIKSSS